MFGKIVGTGSYVPERILENTDLEKMVETDDVWIRERTGICRRHIMAEDEKVSQMAVKAGEKALIAAGIKAEEIDLILVSSVSPDILLPSVSCVVQRELGAVKAACFDLNAACAGFMFAYNTAQNYIAGGMAEHVLVIGVEGLSRIVDWTDRGTCILFGDGAGAVVLEKEEKAKFVAVMHSDGARGEALTCTQSYTDRKRAGIDRQADEKSIREVEKQTQNEASCKTFVAMDGQEVFRFAVKQVPLVVKELLSKLQMEKEELDLLLLHQANQRIVESIVKRVGIAVEKVPMNLQEYGNTSSASIPILLDELVREGKISRGESIIMAGFGAGLSWGATYLEY